MDINFESLQLFIKGMKISREQHAEEPDTYEYGLNGRVFSENGKFSFSSIKGTVEIHNDPNIVKYLGWYAFSDEMVFLVKYDDSEYLSQTVNRTTAIVGPDIEINFPYLTSTVNLTDELSSGASEEISSYVSKSGSTLDDIIEDRAGGENTKTIDFTDLFTRGIEPTNYELCDIEDTSIPDYNRTYIDAIIVITKKADGTFSDRIAWKGLMNWDINRKITTAGIFENNYYKRVYFTDNLNPFRVVNLKDKNLYYRTGDEFNARQDAVMLQPEIDEITETGSLTAMKTQYAYILITENGQRTPFGPFSKLVAIVRDNDPQDFQGGAPEEITNKSVRVSIPIVSLLFSEVQCIALEYGADTVPTAIRNLGIQPVSEIVEFLHTGAEPEWDQSFTLEDIIDASQNWTYCADITIKQNKMIAGGLRNKPIGFVEKEMQDLFYFRGYDESGNTHNELINPTPSVYQFFSPDYTGESIYLKKRVFQNFLFFGNFTLTFRNKNIPGSEQEISFESTKDEYVDYITEIWEWLDGLQSNPGFNTNFPNLNITYVNNCILFEPIDEAIVDFSPYIFESSISQTIINYDSEFVTLTHSITPANRIYGAQSHGFNRGAGVRISWLPKTDVVIRSKANELYDGGVILDLEVPSQKKTFVKDEIYRLGLQCFKNGVPLFTIVLGDVKTPAVGDSWRHLSENGDSIIVPGNKYHNQEIFTNMEVVRFEARVEVRIPCSFKKYVDSYQLVYVERTPINRTVLAQGLAAPLVRLGRWGEEAQSGLNFDSNVFEKWTLPFNGGPLYSATGFRCYDDVTQGENFDDLPGTYGEGLNEANNRLASGRREMISRKLLYFDSPDFIQEKIPTSLIGSGTFSIVGKVRPDHTGRLCRSSFPGDETHNNYQYAGDYFDGGLETSSYKQSCFSRKLGLEHLPGDVQFKPYTVNFSIFAWFSHYDRNDIEIDKHSNMLGKGEIIPASVLSVGHEASNAAVSLFAPHAYYSGAYRSGARSDGDYISQTYQSSKRSEGYPTVFVRTEDEFWTNDMLNPELQNPIYIKPHTGAGFYAMEDIDGTQTYEGQPNIDVHIIANIKRNIEATIYGGRSRYHFSKNVFLPLSKVIPAHLNISNNGPQVFTSEGDFYLTLFMRTKNDNSHDPTFDPSIEVNGGDGWDMQQGINQAHVRDYTRGIGWAYGVVLETEIETRYNENIQMYRENGQFDVNSEVTEVINGAYLKKNDLRIYSPVPYNFKDDPLLTHILSASKVKLSGDYFDAWTVFLINEFYELEKEKGSISNITTWQDELYVIQSDESNKVNLDGTDFITTEAGERVSVQKGDGSTFVSHDKISNYGTAIRRALAEGDFGFSFIDERRKSMIKFAQPISLENEIEFKLNELFEDDEIIDTEGYYDQLYKETNIRIRTASGKAYCISYNEVLQLFNGFIEYDNDVYITFDKRVFAPIRGTKTVVIGVPQNTGESSNDSITGQWFYFEIVGENIVSYELLDSLPAGLSFDSTNGVFSGTISVAGSYPIRVRISNGEETVTETFTFNVSDTSPVITSSCPDVQAAGVPFEYVIVATGEPTIYDCLDLPSGLVVSPTGKITGTTPIAGSYPITLYVENTYGSDTKACTIIVSNLHSIVSTQVQTISGTLIGKGTLASSINTSSNTTV